MNARIFNRCCEVAKALRPKNTYGKSNHFSFCIYKGKIISVGMNNYRKLHPFHKFGRYRDYKGFETQYIASLHSETDLCIKLGENDWSDYEIVNIRIAPTGKLGMSLCCKNCENLIIKPLAPKALFYTDSNGEFQEHNYWESPRGNGKFSCQQIN